jgi:hypothetical protein
MVQRDLKKVLRLASHCLVVHRRTALPSTHLCQMECLVPLCAILLFFDEARAVEAVL